MFHLPTFILTTLLWGVVSVLKPELWLWVHDTAATLIVKYREWRAKKGRAP